MTLERRGWGTLTSYDTPGSLPVGLTDDKPTEWSSRVTFLVGLKNSCRMKKVEQTGPSLLLTLRGCPSFKMSVVSAHGRLALVMWKEC